MSSIKLKLNFLKRILTDSVKNENLYLEFFKTKQFPSEEDMLSVVNSIPSEEILEGLSHPQRGHTMIGLKRLDNVEYILDQIREEKIDGDIIETGVWRGGCCIFIKFYLDLYGINKKVFVADSFEGLPNPTQTNYPQDEGDVHHLYNHLSISLEQVKSNFENYGVLDKNVVFIKGWFSDILRDNKNIGKLSLLRFDGDMYGSTIDVLTNLYLKINKGGYLIVDDYCLPKCKQAVEDYRSVNEIEEEIIKVDSCGVYWQIK